MGRYLVGRLATSVVLFFAITLFVFVAFSAVPASTGATQRSGSIDTYRLHGSLPHRYAHYVWNLVRHGDLGHSYADREAVTTRLFRAAPVTLSPYAPRARGASAKRVSCARTCSRTCCRPS
jgi:ABC-type dipeptide/oligopeptide/nickel transport system permease component